MMPEQLQPLQPEGITAESYALMCKIRVATLDGNYVVQATTGAGMPYLQMGWHDNDGNITYTIDADGKKIANLKFRTAIEGDRFKFAKGSKISEVGVSI